MSTSAIKAIQTLPVWKGGGGSRSSAAGEIARLRQAAEVNVAKRRRSIGERITRPLTVEEAYALRHHQFKGSRERKQPVDILLPDDLDSLPDTLSVRRDGRPVIRTYDTRARIFGAMYRDLLTRYEMVLVLEKDLYMEHRDVLDFRTAIKRVTVPTAGPPDPKHVAALDRWYAETPLRKEARAVLEAEQDRRRFLGHQGTLPTLPLPPFPPQATNFFKEGEPMSPIVHTALRSTFVAISRLPNFQHMAGLPFLTDRHGRTKGNTLLIGIPRFRQDTVSAVLRLIKQYANKPPREFPPLPPPARGSPPRVRPSPKAKRVQLVAGLLHGRYLEPDTLAELAELPPLDQLHGQIVGHIVAASGGNVLTTLQRANARGSELVGVLSQAAGGDVLGKLEGYRRTLEEAADYPKTS